MKEKIAYLLIFVLFAIGFSNADMTDSLQITKKLMFNNPGDSITNPSPGNINIQNSMLRVKSLVQDTNLVPPNTWQVSPSFTLNIYRRTASTITDALNNIDSGAIYVYPGVYSDRITAKNNVTIIGAGREKTWVTRYDSNIVYCYYVSNFAIKNLSVFNSYIITSSSRSAIRLYGCFTDSVSSPKVRFDNIYVYCSAAGTGSDTIFGILSDSSSFYLTSSFIKLSTGVGDLISSCVKLNNMSHPVIASNDLNTGGSNLGIKIMTKDCRPFVYGNRSYNINFIYSNKPITLRNFDNRGNQGNANITDFLTSNNMFDNNFIIR